jgi:hypothetical protein
MKVLVPYLRLHPATVAALHRDHVNPVFVETIGHDGYWDALASMWAQGESFIVLEQDKVPEPGLLQELWGCPEGWCAARAPIRGTTEPATYPSLSCTKFSAELIREYPSLIENVGELDLGFGLKEWSRLDLAIAGLLSAVQEVHWHTGVVEHLHEELVLA